MSLSQTRTRSTAELVFYTWVARSRTTAVMGAIYCESLVSNMNKCEP